MYGILPKITTPPSSCTGIYRINKPLPYAAKLHHQQKDHLAVDRNAVVLFTCEIYQLNNIAKAWLQTQKFHWMSANVLASNAALVCRLRMRMDSVEG